MFPLRVSTWPAAVHELAALLNASFRRLVQLPDDAVTIVGRDFAELDEIAIRLDGGRLKEQPMAPPQPSGEATPALEVERFTISAQPFWIGLGGLNLNFVAHEVALNQALDENGEIVLTFARAAEGRLEIFADKLELDRLLTGIVRRLAGKHGVAIDDVQMNLRPKGERGLTIDARVHARKLFVKALLQFTGEIEIDHELNARIFDLHCTGEGPIAALACSLLERQFAQIEGREFPLAALPLGQIFLRDIHIKTGERVSLEAKFGAARRLPLAAPAI